MLKITQDNGQVRIESRVKGMWFNKNPKIETPDEMSLESGGFVFFTARSKGRKSINKLLARLNQPIDFLR